MAEALSIQRVNAIKDHLAKLPNVSIGRQYLLNELGMSGFIKRRKVEKLGKVPINCEVYECRPDAPVIIFFPGIGTYAEMYCEFLWNLSQCGFNVVGIDPRGHGYSGGTRGSYLIEEVVEDMEEIITFFSDKYNSQIAMFGCSLGSPLAIAVAENDSRVQAALCHTFFIREEPISAVHRLGWQALSWQNLFFPSLRIDFRNFIDVRELLKDNVFGHFMEYDDVMVWSYPVRTLNSVYNRKSKVVKKSFDFKAAILIGDRDQIISMEYTQQIIDKMEHPFELRVVEGGKHMLPFDNTKETILSARDWFYTIFPDAKALART